jgi:hypothetical protein
VCAFFSFHCRLCARHLRPLVVGGWWLVVGGWWVLFGWYYPCLSIQFPTLPWSPSATPCNCTVTVCRNLFFSSWFPQQTSSEAREQRRSGARGVTDHTPKYFQADPFSSPYLAAITHHHLAIQSTHTIIASLSHIPRLRDTATRQPGTASITSSFHRIDFPNSSEQATSSNPGIRRQPRARALVLTVPFCPLELVVSEVSSAFLRPQYRATRLQRFVLPDKTSPTGSPSNSPNNSKHTHTAPPTQGPLYRQPLQP